jgi:hypothetical protein
MVYGRYNELVNGVYKPTITSLGGTIKHIWLVVSSRNVLGSSSYRLFSPGLRHRNPTRITSRNPKAFDCVIQSLQELVRFRYSP